MVSGSAVNEGGSGNGGGKHSHIDFDVEDDEQDEEELRRQFYDKFQQQNGIEATNNGMEEEYEYEEETDPVE